MFINWMRLMTTIFLFRPGMMTTMIMMKMTIMIYHNDDNDDNDDNNDNDENDNNDNCLTCGALECLSFSFAEDTIVSSFYSKAGCPSDNDHQNRDHCDEKNESKIELMFVMTMVMMRVIMMRRKKKCLANGFKIFGNYGNCGISWLQDMKKLERRIIVKIRIKLQSK